METIFLNTRNRKTKESHQFVLNVLQILDLKSSNIHAALQNLCIYYAGKNIRQQYKKINLK